MKVLLLPANISNIQKCYFPMRYFDRIGTYFNKHMILKLTEGYCIVKVLFSGNLHESYCYIDASVCTCTNVTCSSLFREELDISNIVPSDGTFEAKCVNISLVFENLGKLVEWHKRINVQPVLSNILKLYVVSCGQNIFLKCLKEYTQLGIERIAINNIDLRGEKKTSAVNGVVSKIVACTNITVDSELTGTMLLFRSPSDVGGLEKPYSLLTDIVAQFRASRIPYTKRNVLLVGPPGCGKKTLITKVANDCNALVVEINGTEILCPRDGLGRPGEVEENVRYSFGLVRLLSEQLEAKDEIKLGSRTKGRNADSANLEYKLISPFIILFLSQVELMCPNRKRGIGKGLTGQTTQLLGAIDALQDLDNVIIFASTVKVDDVDQALRRPGRLDKEVFIGIPNEEERALMLEKLMAPFVEEKDGSRNSPVMEIARKAAALTPGRVPADLSLLCEGVRRIRLRRKLLADKESENTVHSWLDDFAHCAAKLPISSLVGGPGTLMSNANQSCLHDQRPSLSSIGGLDSVKKRLVMSVKEPLLHPEAFKLLGIRPPRGVLLFGPPGCAKTTLARALAIADFPAGEQRVDQSITFLSCSAAELYSPFVGESEKIVVDLFERARAGAPSIVFIDELDALFGSRDGMHKGGVQERVLAALLMEMDGVGCRLIAPKASFQHNEGEQTLMDPEERDLLETSFHKKYGVTDAFSMVTVIAATNRPDLIDEALLRPGRLDQLVYIPPPNEEARYEILSLYSTKMPIQGDERSIMRDLANKTENYSGADLKNLCKEAALLALSEEGFDVQEVKEKHFMRALELMRSSLSSEQILSYENFSCNKFLR